MAKSKRYKYDVFISHAVEDKLAIANELSEALEKTGLKVWYSGRELSVGDRLIETIHTGLDECRFGVVILSPTYLGKIWALNEFFTLIHREKEGRKVVLPVLYDITPEELGARYPAMADIFAVRANKGMEHVTTTLYNEIIKQQTKGPIMLVDKVDRQQLTKRLGIAAAMLMIIVTSLYGVSRFISDYPPKEMVQSVITDRINAMQREVDQQIQPLEAQGRPATSEEVKKIYSEFVMTKSYFRNEFSLNTGNGTIRGKRNVAMALASDMETFSPFNQYSFTSPRIYHSTSTEDGFRKEQWTFINTEPLTYRIESTREVNHQVQVKVVYDQPIRIIDTILNFPASSKDTKRHDQSITALRPVETYTFHNKGGQWEFKAVE